MRKQIAAANWKMNLTYQQGEKLLDEILHEKIELTHGQQVVFAVPFPYLIMAKSVIGHSERREYFNETNQQLAEKLNLLLEQEIQPIFCCGEPLSVREAGEQNNYVEVQLKESLFHLDAGQLKKVVIAYEPIWAIGTGKTASSEQAQEMHAHIRQVLSRQYGAELANEISILYGGSVKAANAVEIFSQPDVDGGLVGGASLVAAEFTAIIKALKK